MRLRTALLLAWRITVFEPARLLASLGGIGLAVLLMTAQLGFENALLDGSVELLDRLEGDVVLIRARKESFMARDPFRLGRLTQAESIPGVAASAPLYVDLCTWRNREDGRLRPIRVLGFDPDHPVWQAEDLQGWGARLRAPGAALVDARSRDHYGPLDPGPGQVERRSVDLQGQFSLGTDFEADGNLVVGDRTFFRLSNRRPRNAEVGLLRLEPGADPDRVVAALRRALPPDVRVATRGEMRARELAYWRERTQIGKVFAIGTLLGFLVGVLICHQVLYTSVTDHLRQLATLLALGFERRALVLLVLAQALLLSLLALPPALLAGWGLYRLLAGWTGLPLRLTPDRVGLLAGLTVSMCALAGCLALRRLLRVDPAEAPTP